MTTPTNPHEGINQIRDDLARQQRRIIELERQLANARNGQLPEDEHIDPDLIYISSIVASKTGEPMVMIRWLTHIAQLPIGAAREIAFNLLDAVEAAKSDAFLMKFGREMIGIGETEAGKLVMAFRQYREKSE
jgi:hypothetical protein